MAVSPYATTNRNTSEQIRQVDTLLELMSPTEVPLLKLFGIKGDEGTNRKFEWEEGTLLAESDTIESGSAVTSSASGTTFEPAISGNGINYQADMVLRLTDTSAGTFEHVYVTNVTGDVVTVVRAVAGTSALATFAAGDLIDIIGLANLENDDAPVKATTELSPQYNYFQAFDTSYQMSYMQQVTPMYGIDDDDAKQLADAFTEIAIKLEKAVIYGMRRINETVGVTAIPHFMGGLWYFFSSAYGTNHYEYDMAGNSITEKDLNDMFQDRYYAVGQAKMGRTLLVGVWNKRKIGDMFAPSHRSERAERVGGVVVDELDTVVGPVDVVLSFRIPKNRVFLINTEWCSVHPYKGLAFFDEEKASLGAYVRREIYGVYTFKCKNTKSGGVLTNTSIA